MFMSLGGGSLQYGNDLRSLSGLRQCCCCVTLSRSGLDKTYRMPFWQLFDSEQGTIELNVMGCSLFKSPQSFQLST